MRRLLLLLPAALLALAGCRDPSPPADGGSPTADGRSGIEGVVLVGPQCPVVQEGSPCPDEPYSAEIRILDQGTQELVETVVSGSDGRFRVALPPGSYLLDPQRPDPSAPFPIAGPIPVTVVEGEYTSVTISYDTGIR
ncbi:MAG: hypothetical protein HY658_00735 [Actinobacteria bacterium]|nr:hypothetical protein [Actinomycetota bacterium]